MRSLFPINQERFHEQLSAWLGDGYYHQGFRSNYESAFVRIVGASRGLPYNNISDERRDAFFDAMWEIFASVMDGYARQVLQSHTATGTPSLTTWPDDVRSRVQELIGARTAPRLNLNRASATALESLPGIGRKTAARIVALRTARGKFRSLDELADVKGLSRTARERALAFLTLRPAPRPTALTHTSFLEENNLTFPVLMRTLVQSGLGRYEELAAGRGGQTAARLTIQEIRRAAQQASRRPYWQSDRKARLDDLEMLQKGLNLVEALHQGSDQNLTGVAVLRNTPYQDLILHLIENAQRRIYVRMFVFTTFGQNTPGSRYAEALEAAIGRGVDVRVVLETDMEQDDPDQTLDDLNEETLARLEAGNVPTRLDWLAVKTHSKVLITDDDQLVIGSHNWSTHSLYQMDETSLYIECSRLVEEDAAHFLDLWAAYDRDPNQRTIAFRLLCYPTEGERELLSAAGIEHSRALLDKIRVVQAAPKLATQTSIDPERLKRLWRMLRLMHAFELPEPTAFALTLTDVDSPSEFRRAARALVVRKLRALDRLPPPFENSPLRIDLVEALDV